MHCSPQRRAAAAQLACQGSYHWIVNEGPLVEFYFLAGLIRRILQSNYASPTEKLVIVRWWSELFPFSILSCPPPSSSSMTRCTMPTMPWFFLYESWRSITLVVQQFRLDTYSSNPQISLLLQIFSEIGGFMHANGVQWAFFQIFLLPYISQG